MGEATSNSHVITEAGDGGREASAADASAVSWERFLPKMVVRVLLVEADDSTRQIIAALLRRCSYRVAAVPDGLKAWELLKGRPHYIDLILTEVELPSISGYALLTLIMEHEVCKNIPVIMMSSHDSVSTVYKCMLRGAVDFLVKPVRKNELRNLWQHVWRKQASNTGTGLGPPFESVAHEKDEATAENNETRSSSSGCKSSIKRNKEGIEKGNDAQSSCTQPEFETEKEDADLIRHLSLPKSDKCLADEDKIPAQERHHHSRKRQEWDQEDVEFQPVQKMLPSHTATQRVENAQNLINLVADSNHILNNSSRRVIDLITGFDNQVRGNLRSPDSNISANKFDVLPLLDLTLRRSHPSGSLKQQNDGMHKLNHSNASPFSRYINKTVLLHSSTLPVTGNQQKDHVTGDSDTAKLDASIREGKQENAFSHSQAGEISHPIPVKGVILESLMSAYSAKGPLSLPSPVTVHNLESSPQLNPYNSQPSTSHQYHSLVDNQSINNSNEQTQTDNKPGKKLEKLEDPEHVSPANDQSTKSSFCNGHLSNTPSSGCGSNGNTNRAPIAKARVDCGNEESLHGQEVSSHRSIQREAALTKFRLKRKDRCFEKKVRYESRKKLAEQRPRVKGQFVRQPPNDTQPRSSSAG